jgi:hypothetical protein
MATIGTYSGRRSRAPTSYNLFYELDNMLISNNIIVKELRITTKVQTFGN